LTATDIPTLLVEGDNAPGIGYRLARAIADAGINLSFLVTQVIGKRYASVFGFTTDDEAKRATSIIKKASQRRGRG
jgi:hypothetical protein